MNLEFNIPNMVDLKKSYDEDGYNHIPELFSASDMDILNNSTDENEIMEALLRKQAQMGAVPGEEKEQ